MKPLLIIALGFSLVSALAQQVQPPPISLVQAVESALGKHPTLLLQAQQVLLNKGAKLEASSQFDTALNVSGNQNRVSTPLTQLEIEEAAASGIQTQSQSTNLTQYNAGSQTLLRSGIELVPSVGLTRTTDNLTNQGGINQSQVSFEIILPLLRNRGREVVTAHERSAQSVVDASTYDLAETAAQLISNVTIAYWNYVASYHALDVARGSEERGKLLVENTRILIQADRMAPADSYDVTANLADRTTSRIAAEQQVVQSRQALAIAMGLGREELFSLGPPQDDWPALPAQAVPTSSADALRSFMDEALRRRATYLAAQKRVEAASILSKAAINQLKPQVNLSFSAGYAGLQNGRRPWEFVYPLGYGVFGPSLSGGVTYSFPIGNRFAQGQLVQADATTQQAVLQQSDTGRTISSNVIVAATTYENSIPRLTAARSTVSGFQQALTGEFDKLRLGVGSLVDILTIEDRLTTALNSEVSAALVYATALVQFRFETGTLMSPDKMVQTVSRDVLLTPPAPEIPAVKRTTP